MDQSGVTYTIKELIAMLEKTLSGQMSAIMVRIEELDKKIDLKVSELRVDNLETRIAENEKRLNIIELTTAGQQAVSKFQRWAIGTVGVGVLSAIATLVWLAAGGH